LPSTAAPPEGSVAKRRHGSSAFQTSASTAAALGCEADSVTPLEARGSAAGPGEPAKDAAQVRAAIAAPKEVLSRRALSRPIEPWLRESSRHRGTPGRSAVAHSWPRPSRACPASPTTVLPLSCAAASSAATHAPRARAPLALDQLPVDGRTSARSRAGTPPPAFGQRSSAQFRGPSPTPADAGRINAPETGCFYLLRRMRSRFGRQLF
jgi:hypothetical protein